jgi:hypothetical protein
MIETDYIKRRIEYLKYTTTTYTGALIVMLWKIYSEPNSLIYLDKIEKGFLIGIAFVFFLLVAIGTYQWYQQVEELNN